MSIADWLAFKTEMVKAAGLERDALHIYFAVAVQAAVAIVRRRGMADWLPWLAVLVIELVNEVLDLRVELWPEPGMQAAQAVHDIVNTMILPTFLYMVARFAPSLLGRRT